jgi:hypothetical protein
MLLIKMALPRSLISTEDDTYNALRRETEVRGG